MEHLIFFDDASTPIREISALQNYIKSIANFYWPLNETSGLVAVNACNPGTNDGSIEGSPTMGIAGQLGNAISFDGSNDTIDFGSSVAFAPGASSFSVGLICYQSGTVSQFPLSSRTASMPAAIQGYELVTTFGGTAGRVNFRASNGTTIFGDVATYDTTHNAWHLLIGVINRSDNTLKLYVDGVERVNISGVSGSISNPQNPKLCNRSSSFYAQSGIQHVFIANSALTPAQCLQIAQLAGLA